MSPKKSPYDMQSDFVKLREKVAELTERDGNWHRVNGEGFAEEARFLEESCKVAFEAAKLFTDIDEHATKNKTSPADWRLGREFTQEEVDGARQTYPELRRLSSDAIISLVRAGFGTWQIRNFVRDVITSAPAENQETTA